MSILEATPRKHNPINSIRINMFELRVSPENWAPEGRMNRNDKRHAFFARSYSDRSRKNG